MAMRPLSCLATLLACLCVPVPAVAASLDIQAVNDAQWTQRPTAKGRIAPMMIKAQVLLDRARFSPGEIDGKSGENFSKALKAFTSHLGLNSTGQVTEEAWRELTSASSEPVLIEYTITDEDVRGPFVQSIPKKLELMKDLPALGYTSAREKIAEKFHMSQDLLQTLNPGEKFDTAGHKIVVTNVATGDLRARVTRIEVDKSSKVVKAFGRDQRLLAVYPATIGSAEKPAPSGQLTVTGVSKNPTYRYNPKYEFKGVRATKPFTIRPGPNNPVGVVWIGLSSEGYGIHGTPDPSKVSKTQSHGCIRLTNWDALSLASATAKGTIVDFSGDGETDRTVGQQARRRK
jgi:lipoprotein-anchoring transpeptidase ErfK/SrfK